MSGCRVNGSTYGVHEWPLSMRDLKTQGTELKRGMPGWCHTTSATVGLESTSAHSRVVIHTITNIIPWILMQIGSIWTSQGPTLEIIHQDAYQIRSLYGSCMK